MSINGNAHDHRLETKENERLVNEGDARLFAKSSTKKGHFFPAALFSHF
jgi:hypothetical protein